MYALAAASAHFPRYASHCPLFAMHYEYGAGIGKAITTFSPAHLNCFCAILLPVNQFLLTTTMSNPHPIPNWEPGKSGNPNGRPVGSRNKRTREIIEQIIASGNKDPLVTLSEIQNSSPDLSVRATAASMLAPYLHGKITPSPMPRFVETEIQLPPLDSLENAVSSIALIESAVASNQLDVQSANDLIGMINAFIAGKNIMEIAELQERLAAIESAIAASPASSQQVYVEGGLPPLPGTSILGLTTGSNKYRKHHQHSANLP